MSDALSAAILPEQKNSLRRARSVADCGTKRRKSDHLNEWKAQRELFGFQTCYDTLTKLMDTAKLL